MIYKGWPWSHDMQGQPQLSQKLENIETLERNIDKEVKMV